MICLEDADLHTRNKRNYTVQEEIDVYNPIGGRWIFFHSNMQQSDMHA